MHRPPHCRATFVCCRAGLTDLALSKTKFVYIEAENSSDQPICNVKAVVYFYDAWGNLAAKSDGVAMIDRLDPGLKNPDPGGAVQCAGIDHEPCGAALQY